MSIFVPEIRGSSTWSSPLKGRSTAISSKDCAAPLHPRWSTPPTRRVLSRSLWHRSEEHTSELQSLMRISYAVFCLKKQNISKHTHSARPYHLYSSTHTYFTPHTSLSCFSNN